MNNLLTIGFLLLFATVAICDTSLNDAYSGAITQVWKDGRFQSLHQEWFGAQPRPVPQCLKFFDNNVARFSHLDRVLRRGVVRVGVGLLNAPYSFVNATGSLDGFDIQLAKLLTSVIAARYNKTIHVDHVVVEDFYNGLPQGIQDGDFDVIISDFTINEERSQVLQFTCSYLRADMGFLRSGLEPERQFNSVADLNQPSVLVILFSGTMLDPLVRNILPQATFVSLGEEGSKDVGLMDVINGIADNEGHVTLLPEGLITWYLANRPSGVCDGCSLLDLNVVPPFYRGIATRKFAACPRDIIADFF